MTSVLVSRSNDLVEEFSSLKMRKGHSTTKQQVLWVELFAISLKCKIDVNSMAPGPLMRRRQSGLSLGSVLLIALFVSTLLFALASTSVSHLHLRHHRSNSQVAELEAQSLVNLALAQVLQMEQVGETEEMSQVVFQAYPERTVSYEPGDTPYCTNNLLGTGSAEGWGGRVVPPESLHLVAQATEGGVSRIVEAVYFVPAFPYAVASASPIRSDGTVLVGSVESKDDASDGVDAGELGPADLFSNASGAAAVALSPGSEVKGNVGAVGEVALNGAVVAGDVDGGRDAVPLPKINVQRHDPRGLTGTNELSRLAPEEIPRALEGLNRHQGDLELTGPLELDNAVLFVDGDFVLRRGSSSQGGLRGYGALIVNGETRIEGASDFAHANGLALLSEGDLVIQGDGLDDSYFQGMLYSNGSVATKNVTILGGIISNSEGDSDGVLLEDSKAIHVPELLTINVESPPIWSFSAPTEGIDMIVQPEELGDIGALEFTVDYSIDYDFETETLVITPSGKAGLLLNDLYLMAHRRESPESRVRLGGLTSHELTFADGSSVEGHALEPSFLGTDTLDSLAGDSLRLRIPFEEIRRDSKALVGLNLPAAKVGSRLHDLTPGTDPTSAGTEYIVSPFTAELDEEQAAALRTQILAIVSGTISTPGAKWNFDPNQYLSLAEKIRISYWDVR